MISSDCPHARALFAVHHLVRSIQRLLELHIHNGLSLLCDQILTVELWVDRGELFREWLLEPHMDNFVYIHLHECSWDVTGNDVLSLLSVDHT